MRDELLQYYERELGFLRQMGAEFAQRYPRVADRLLLERDKCDDPHVERIIEAFAFLAGRIQLKLDDEFPEMTESLLNVLYPHYLAPIPSMSIIQLSLDRDQGKMTTGYPIDRHSTVYSRPVQGTPCRFRTCHPVTLWPIEVASATFTSDKPVDSKGVWSDAQITIVLRCLNDATFAELLTGDETRPVGIDSLRFYLNGEPQLVYYLYETIFNHVSAIDLVAGDKSKTEKSNGNRLGDPVNLPLANLRSVGFEPDEEMLPYTARSFEGYRLLTEYFCFPEKFLFFEVAGLDRVAKNNKRDTLSITLHLKNVTPPRFPVDENTFLLGCTPIVNLFRKVAEPIQVNQHQTEYHVIPDIHRQMATEIYSIDSVTSTDPFLKESRQFNPLYGIRHSYETTTDQSFWYGTRRQSQIANDNGTECYLSLVDLNFNPKAPATETLTLHTTCSNRDLPARIQSGFREGDFELETSAPISRIKCLRKPTATIRPPLRGAAQWRLISHLSLNHLSITAGDNKGSPDALRELLMLYDFSGSSATRKQILGITRIDTRPAVMQLGNRIGTGFVRGVETTLEFDEEQFAGSNLFLFACVLERFLALYASVNSFTQMVAVTKQREGHLKRWSPRSGQQTLL